MERPRKKNAEKTSRNIAADEYVHDTKGVALNWDGKRDRYNGFDAEDYGRVVARFEKAETLKQEVAKKKVRTITNRLPRHQPRFGPSVPE